MDYYYRNHPKEKARRSARRSYFRQATPAWADLKAIAQFYQGCPAGSEVDHVVPIKGRKVCGLHVIDNLQYLSTGANRSKLNRFEIA